MKVCGLKNPPILQPVVADFYNGMLVSVPLHPALMQMRMDMDALTELYRAHYRGKAMIRVPGPNPEPVIAANKLCDSDTMEIFLTGSGERIIACARFDNLGKGACGMAIQNLDLMLGIEEGDT